MGNVGYLHLSVEPHCPRCCPASFALPLTVKSPVEISPKLTRSGFRQVAKTDRLKIGIRARLHPGIGTGLISEC